MHIFISCPILDSNKTAQPAEARTQLHHKHWKWRNAKWQLSLSRVFKWVISSYLISSHFMSFRERNGPVPIFSNPLPTNKVIVRKPPSLEGFKETVFEGKILLFHRFWESEVRGAQNMSFLELEQLISCINKLCCFFFCVVTQLRLIYFYHFCTSP